MSVLQAVKEAVLSLNPNKKRKTILDNAVELKNDFLQILGELNEQIAKEAKRHNK